MVYPVKMHVRYSTVMVIVVLLMGSVLYEVTRTEALARQSAARTQDIALPAPQPVTHTVKPYTNFIGSSSVGRSAIQPFQPSHELLASAAYGSVTVVRAAYFQRAYASRGLAAAFNGRSFITRGRSSGGTGYAAGSYGMGGVGAWGGVSGMMRPNAPSANLAENRPVRRAAQAARTPAPRRNNNGSGGSGGATSGGGSSAGAGTDATGASLPPGGFSTGAAAVEPGAVAGVGAAAVPSPSPAPTPEPMSLLLVGGGLAALYKVRQRLQ